MGGISITRLKTMSKLEVISKCFCMVPIKSGEIIRILDCGHAFHQHCIDTWFDDNSTCVMCRKDLNTKPVVVYRTLDPPRYNIQNNVLTDVFPQTPAYVPSDISYAEFTPTPGY